MREEELEPRLEPGAGGGLGGAGPRGHCRRSQPWSWGGPEGESRKVTSCPGAGQVFKSRVMAAELSVTNCALLISWTPESHIPIGRGSKDLIPCDVTTVPMYRVQSPNKKSSLKESQAGTNFYWIFFTFVAWPLSFVKVINTSLSTQWWCENKLITASDNSSVYRWKSPKKIHHCF